MEFFLETKTMSRVQRRINIWFCHRSFGTSRGFKGSEEVQKKNVEFQHSTEKKKVILEYTENISRRSKGNF